jgi:uncharacterized protein (TIGR01244 family)
MDIKTIERDLSVSPQWQPQDVGVAAALGDRSIIISHQDGEGGDHPCREATIESVGRHGLTARFVTVVSGNLADAELDGLGKAMHESQEAYDFRDQLAKVA